MRSEIRSNSLFALATSQVKAQLQLRTQGREKAKYSTVTPLAQVVLRN